MNLSDAISTSLTRVTCSIGLYDATTSARTHRKGSSWYFMEISTHLSRYRKLPGTQIIQLQTTVYDKLFWNHGSLPEFLWIHCLYLVRCSYFSLIFFPWNFSIRLMLSLPLYSICTCRSTKEASFDNWLECLRQYKKAFSWWFSSIYKVISSTSDIEKYVSKQLQK